MSITYVLKTKNLHQSLESYVSGTDRFNFIKKPILDDDEESPVIFERIIDNKNDNIVVIKEKRSIGCQTLFRESEAQTNPAPLGEIENNGEFLEILELREFSYGNGLPVTMNELELIAKAREKRAFNDGLPPLSDEACFNLRNKLTQEQEFREWTQKENELKEINQQRLISLEQLLSVREMKTEEKRMAKIDELKGKKDEEVETHVMNTKKQRVKIIRAIEKAKENANRKEKFKRDIILDYTSFGSKVYAPLTRDGHNPDRHPFQLLDLHSDDLTSFEGISQLETNISEKHLNSKVDIIELNKQYKNSLKKGEVRHLQSIDGAFESIKKHEQRKIEFEREEERRRIEESKARQDKTKTSDKKSDEISYFEDIVLLQRLLRGRREQIVMHEGKNKRAELIKELRGAVEWKKVSDTDNETKLIDNYIEKLMNGVVDAIQGQNISATLDFLSKEKIRIKEEMKINAIVEQAENERRRREAEEMGRRQAENLLRERQDILYKGMLQVNQATMDSYINSIISGTVNNVSKKQVMKELEIKAHKLNIIVDKIENKLVKDDVVVRDLVSSFIIPDINRKKVEDKIELEEKRFIETAQNSILTSLSKVKEKILEDKKN